MDLLIDFETRCDLNIKKVGAMKYIYHPSFRVLSLAYMSFDPITLLRHSPTKLWTHQEPIGINFPDYNFIWALNVGFDFHVNNVFNRVNQLNILSNRMSTSIDYWKDIQVVLSKFSLPQGLADAANVLRSPIKKNPRGSLIISRCCKKNSNPSQEDLNELYAYNITDVDASFEVLKACPSTVIVQNEWDLWRETFRMNDNGLPIDYPAVEKIKERVDAFKETICDSLPDLTGGLITKPTQTARIKAYLNDHGVPVKNTTADTLEKLMDQHEREPFLPDDCFQLIQARQAGGASSVAKFDKLLDMRIGDKVHDFIRYGATSTQRWAGAGYQVHSLPKKTVADPEALIADFMNFNHIDNPMLSAKALCRSVIKAPPGQLLYQGDFSSIEYLLLIWITDMQDKLQMFKEGKSAYIDMAAFLFDKKYEEIDKYAIDNLEYFLGKQVILGCGYQMGAKKFGETCEKYGVKINGEQALRSVTGYRTMYKPVTSLWKAAHKAAIAAIASQTKTFEAFKCKFVCMPDKKGVVWLIVTLPSKTKLFYHSPEISKGTYGPEIKHMGLVNYKWVRRFLSPGRLVENIIQKLARDLMGYSILSVNNDINFQVLMTVHDELVALGSDVYPDSRHEELIRLMEKVPSWAKTIPLRAGGFYGRRYKKD